MNGELLSNEHEWQAQETALKALRKVAPVSGDARIDTYRLAFHAVARVPRSQPPEDFAAAVVRAVRDAQGDEYIERWMIPIAALLGLACLVFFAGPMLVDSLKSSLTLALLPGAGWLSSPLLWAATAGAASAAGIDMLRKAID
jgi:hypothetical protein